MRFFKPISRKQDSIVIGKIVQRQQKKKLSLALGELREHINYSLLYQNENCEWRIINKDNSEEIPVGNYIFVRTLTGFMRISPNAYSHSTLADYKKDVAYAGEILFDKDGKLVMWNNRSGTYQPDAVFFKQAKLPPECFVPEISRQLKSERLIPASILKTPKRNRLGDKYQLLRISPPPSSLREDPVESIRHFKATITPVNLLLRPIPWR